MTQKSHFLSGAAAATVSASLSQPFDVVKTYYLTGQSSARLYESVTFIYKRYGVLGFWRGYQPLLIRAILGGGSIFYFLEYFKRLMEHRALESLSFSANVLASALARVLTTMLLCPITVVKVRMEAPQGETYKNVFHGISRIYKTMGVRGYYVGLGPNLLRDVPFSGLAYGFYQYYYSVLEGFPYANFIGATLGAFTATMLTQPFDVLKIRLQYTHVDSAQLHNYKGMFDGIHRIWNHEGLKGFTRGLVIRLAERSFSYGVVWSVYERVKSSFK